MASLRKRGKVWYYRFIDADGISRERKGCPDKRETESMAAGCEAEASKVRAGLIDPKALVFRGHEARPIGDHLADFKAALTAKGGSPKHASVSHNRVQRLLNLSGVKRVSEISLSKAHDALSKLRSEGLSAETINHHVRAVKAFARWLWRDGRTRDHYLAHLATSNSEGDRRRRRRTLSPEEATRLVKAAKLGPFVMGLTGPDRARCYELALGTGLRASELASLTPERFDLDTATPSVTVPAAYTKNHKEAVQPLAPGLASRLRPWIDGLERGRLVFALSNRTAEMLRVDLDAAGIDYETDSGVMDFHALRGVYITDLVSSGASVKTCQILARHSTPSLTIGVYAKASLHDIGRAVDSLPDHSPTARKPNRWPQRGPKAIISKISVPIPCPSEGTERVGTCRSLANMTT